jgi:hypothetical protein
MVKNIANDKTRIPEEVDLMDSLGNTYPFWNTIKDFVRLKYPEAREEWNYSGEKYGWSFRMKDKKRAIIYLLTRDRYFTVALVFGQKAANRVLTSPISEKIKTELENARVYAEGRGIRIEVKDELIIDDIKALIEIKISS